MATADANPARQEKAIALKEKEVELTERTLEATVKKQADAERYAKQQESDASLYEIQRKSEAQLFERQKNAEADKFEREKEAEAMKQMGEAAVLEMYFKAMPEIAGNIAEPLAKVDRIPMYGDGNSSKLMKDIMGTLTQVTDGLKESTGIDLGAVLAGFAGAKLADSDKQ